MNTNDDDFKDEKESLSKMSDTEMVKLVNKVMGDAVLEEKELRVVDNELKLVNKIDMSDLDKEEAHLKFLLEEVERKRKERALEVVITIEHFNPTSGLLSIKVSKFRDDIINLLRFTPSRQYSESKGLNYVNENYFNEFANKLNVLPMCKLIWNDGVKESLETYRNTPQYSFEFDSRRSNIIVRLSNRATRITLYELDTWTYNQTSNLYTFNVAELYKIPEVLKNRFDNGIPKKTYKLSEEVEKILKDQLDKIAKLEALHTALDAPEIQSPFTEIDPKTGKPYELTADQRVAIAFDELTNHRTIVGYDMGKGKTAIAIAIAERNNWRVLFICKADLKTNIKREIKKFMGKEAIVFSGIEPDSLSIDYLFTKKQQYNILNYDIIGRATIIDKGKPTEHELLKWAEVINLSKFDAIFYDEAHYMKNMESARSKGGRLISEMSNAVALFTGTMVVNRPKELFPLLNICDRETFHNFAGFDRNYSDGKNGVRNAKGLNEILKRYAIIRKNVGLDINRIPYSVDLSSEGRALYNKAIEGIYIDIHRGTQSDITSILAQFTRLKQIVAKDVVDGTVSLCEEVLDQTEKKVIIFSQYKDVHAMVANKLGSKCAVINGDVTDDWRYETVDKFQDPNSSLKVLVTNIMEGLTLTAAHTVIFNDLWWTPKDHLQGEGRAFGRSNDYHSGNSYYIEASDTIMQMIRAILAEKIETKRRIEEGDDSINDNSMNESVINRVIQQIKMGPQLTLVK